MNVKLLAVSMAAVLAQFGTSFLCAAAKAAYIEQNPDAMVERPPSGLFPSAILALAPESFPRYALLVDKSRRTLSVWENAGDKIRLVDTFPADVGAQSGDKINEGDSRTPEGIYFLQASMEGRLVDFQKYGERIFTMDYPNLFDRQAGKSGRGIWLHSVPDSVSLQRGSHGCVVLRNRSIADLAQYIELKETPIIVAGQVAYMNEKEWLEQRLRISQWLEEWRANWAEKNLAKYVAQYAERFHGDGLGKIQWLEHKNSLAERSQSLDITLQDVQIFAEGHQAVVRFRQNYRSDQRADVGLKTLYVLDFKIIDESWKPAAGQTLSSQIMLK